MEPEESASSYFESPETDGELLPVVDWDDREVELRPRREIHLEGLLHRAAHVIVVNGGGEVVLQRRSPRKDHYPGWWDVSVGGHVGPGETYLETARREIREELGVDGTEPLLVGILAPSVFNGWEHIHVFVSRVDGDVRPDPAEVTAHRWIDPREVLAHYSPDSPDEDTRITPSGLTSIRLWWDAGAPGRKTPPE